MTKKFILSCMTMGILAGSVCSNVSASQKGKIDPFHMQIVAQHMKTKDDLLNITQLSKNKEFIIDRMRVNPHSIEPKDLKFFSHIDTLRLETIDDVKAFLHYDPDQEYEKFPERSNLRKNRGRFAKIEVTARVNYSRAVEYLKKLKTLLRDWEPDLTKEKLNEEFKKGNVDFLKEIVKRYRLSNLTEEQLEEAVINKDTLFLDEIVNRAEEIRERLVANKVKFFNILNAPVEKIGHLENGEFKFNDNIYDGDGNDIRKANKTYFIKSIGGFKNMVNLESIKIPNSVTSIGYYAFEGCIRLTKVNIPNSVTSIRNNTFKGCTRLTKVAIPDSVTSIESKAFKGCTGLNEITIPDSVTSIEGGAFNGCSQANFIVPSNAMKNYLCDTHGIDENRITVDDSLSNPQNAWKWPENGNVDVPRTVTCLDESIFKDRKDIKSVTIPNSVRVIGSCAFMLCDNLTSVTLMKGLERICDSAFERCTRLKHIAIPDGIKFIDEGAFYKCYSCTFVVPNDEVKSMLVKTNVNEYRIAIAGRDKPWWIPDGDGKITVPGDVECIDGDMFGHRADIKHLEIVDGVKFVYSDAFVNCVNLESVTIPDSVTLIYYGAFDGCSQANFIVPSNAMKNYLRDTNGIDENRITVDDSLSNPQNAWKWPENGHVEIPQYITNIEDNMFYRRKDIKSVTIKNSVIEIGRKAFSGCEGLTSVTIPDSVQSIGEDAFRWCTGLNEVNVSSEYAKNMVLNSSSGVDPDIIKVIK